MFAPTLTRAATTTASASLAHPRRASQWLALGAVAGPVLFTLAWLILGLLQPAASTPFGVIGGLSGTISNPISGIGVGPNAAVFNAAFVVCGLLQLVGAVGALESTGSSRRRGLRIASDVLLALSPLALSLVGIFTLGNALLLHIVFGMLLFVSPVLSFLVTGIYLRGVQTTNWRRFGTLLLLASPLTLLLFVGYSISFDQVTVAAGQGVAGLTERVLMLEIQAWYVALGWRAFRRL